MPMDDRWGDTGTWVGDDLRREVFFFDSGGERLYGSVYAAAPSAPAAGVAICNSWGFEGNQSDATMHAIALRTARHGGAGALFHYPGYGDSHGDPSEVSIDSLVDAAVDAVDEARRRLPGTRWTLAGLMFGASVATLAARRAEIDRLLLIQPALHVSSYFSRLERSARRAAVRVPARAGNAYGYPLPTRILEAAPAIDVAVAEALAQFDGKGAVVRYEEPPRREPIPERFEDVVVPGSWRFGTRQKGDLAKAAANWLRATVEA
jgi:pimeloyl-ACP methyl ester carboxylesterase